LKLHKLENGQYEIAMSDGEEMEGRKPERSTRRGRRGRERDGNGRKAKADGTAVEPSVEPDQKAAGDADGKPASAEAVHAAYDLLRRAAAELGADEEKAVRDSDVKRRMLDLDPDWDESVIGFSKFSRFLRHAHDAEVINLRKVDSGNYEVALPAGAVVAPEADAVAPDRTVGSRRGAKSRTATDAAPPVLEGQVVNAAPAKSDGAAGLEDLDLPNGRDEIVLYLTKAYKGIGRKTAETLVDEIGPDSVFGALHGAPDRIKAVVGGKRGDTLLDAWRDDYAARIASRKEDGDGGERKRGRRGGRRRGGRGRKKAAKAGD
jgi:hypothetical protein